MLTAKGNSRKSFQVNEQETNWGGFIVDADAIAVLADLKRAKKATSHDDAGIVAEAWSESRTIVTSNRRHFLRHIQEYQSRANRKECRDLWGLVVVPNPQLDREKGIRSVRNGLAVPGVGILRWPGAGMLNLYVRLTAEGSVEISRFARCLFCADTQNGVKIKEPWGEWYSSLPVGGDG